jgi:hypothetical protein
MGEVYRARDTRLERTVAIKILPEHLSSNSELRARFEREARAVSSLNHPHICHLYDIGSQDGIAYLVMEQPRVPTGSHRDRVWYQRQGPSVRDIIALQDGSLNV